MASPKPCHQTHHATMEQDGFAKTFAKRMNPTCHNAAPMPPNGLHLRLRPCHQACLHAFGFTGLGFVSPLVSPRVHVEELQTAGTLLDSPIVDVDCVNWHLDLVHASTVGLAICIASSCRGSCSFCLSSCGGSCSCWVPPPAAELLPVGSI